MCCVQQKLANGLTLQSYQQPRSYSVTVALYLRGGSACAPDGSGIAHLVEHLCFRCWRDLEQRQFYDKIERTGGFLYGATAKKMMNFSLTVHPRFFREAVEIAAGLFDDCDWRYEELRQEKAVVQRELAGKGDDFYRYIQPRYFAGSAFAPHTIGTAAKIARLSKARLYDWRRRLFNPTDSCVIIAGAFSDTNLDEASHVFAAIPTRAGLDLSPLLTKPTDFGKRREDQDCIYHDQCAWAEVSICFDVDNAQVTRLEGDLLFSMLFSGLGNPFILRLREELGLIYEINGSYEHYPFGSAISLEFTVCNEQLPLLFAELGCLFAQVKKSIPRNAFDSAKAFSVYSQERLLDNSRGLTDLRGEWGFIDGLPLTTVEAMLQAYAEISGQRINDLAQLVFRPRNLSIYVLRDPERITTRAVSRGMSNLRKTIS